MKRKLAVKLLKLSAVLVVLHFGSRGYIAAQDAVFGQVAQATEQVVAYSAHTLGYVRPAPQLEEHTLDDLIELESVIAGVNPSLMRSLVHVESRGRKFAESPKGAIGPAQIMGFNAKRCGLEHYSQLWDARTNIKCGVQILSEELRAVRGDVVRALWRYNGGAKCDHGACKESREYAAAVLARWTGDIR